MALGQQYILVSKPELDEIINEPWFKQECYPKHALFTEQILAQGHFLTGNYEEYFVPEHRAQHMFMEREFQEGVDNLTIEEIESHLTT